MHLHPKLPKNTSKRIAGYHYCQDPNCESTQIIEGDSNYVCTECGLVQDFEVISQDERRAFDKIQKEKRKRTEVNNSSGYHTMIGSGAGDLKDLSAKELANVYRLRRAQTHSQGYDTRKETQIINKTKLYATSLGLEFPRLQDTITHYYKATCEYEIANSTNEKRMRVMRGRSMNAFSACYLRAASMTMGRNVSFKELSAACSIGERELGKTWRVLLKHGILNNQNVQKNDENNVSRYCSELGLSSDVESFASMTYSRAKKAGLTSGRDPKGVAAASIYVASQKFGENRTQRAVSKVAHITEVTLRTRYKELYAKFGKKK